MTIPSMAMVIAGAMVPESVPARNIHAATARQITPTISLSFLIRLPIFLDSLFEFIFKDIIKSTTGSSFNPGVVTAFFKQDKPEVF